MKLQPVRAELLRGRTDGWIVEGKHDETNKIFRNFANACKIQKNSHFRKLSDFPFPAESIWLLGSIDLKTHVYR